MPSMKFQTGCLQRLTSILTWRARRKEGPQKDDNDGGHDVQNQEENLELHFAFIDCDGSKLLQNFITLVTGIVFWSAVKDVLREKTNTSIPGQKSAGAGEKLLSMT